jgi:site-specific recombinase XerD
METKMSILFYGKTSKTTTDGKVPIYLRITINSRRFEVSTNNYVEPSRWQASTGKVKGNSEEARTINAHLDLLKHKAYDYRQEVVMQQQAFTIETFKCKWLGQGENQHTLMQVIREHNSNLEKLIGKGYVKATWVKYKTTEKHIEEFIRWQYRLSDLRLRSIKYEFVTNLEFYLKSEKNMSVNSYGKIIKNLKKIIHECVAKDWLNKDPFMLYKVKHIDPQVPHLTAEELQRIENKVFTIERLALVKDLFLFSCYTGLAYIDAVQITPENIIIGFDGKKWLIKNREKTDVASRIPLLSPALVLLAKYKNHPKTCNTGRLLPTMANQKVNSYLKEIADLCGIKKKVTFHVARHTFATTVTLSNGVPMETVSKMLGHKKLKTTQIYSEVVDMKVSQDMKQLETRFSDTLSQA